MTIFLVEASIINQFDSNDWVVAAFDSREKASKRIEDIANWAKTSKRGPYGYFIESCPFDSNGYAGYPFVKYCITELEIQ